MSKKNEILVKEQLEPTIDNAIRSMKLSIKLHITKNDKYWSDVVDEYIRDKEKFLPFIKEDQKECFLEVYASIFQLVEQFPTKFIKAELLAMEQTCQIMELLNADTDWDAIDRLLDAQCNSAESIEIVNSWIQKFSSYGSEFEKHINKSSTSNKGWTTYYNIFVKKHTPFLPGVCFLWIILIWITTANITYCITNLLTT